jgi:tetratricopeptide (TPR) repeat protein
MRTAADLPDGVRELIIEGRAAWRDRDYDRARTLFEEALVAAEQTTDLFARVSALHFLGNVAFNQCRDGESRSLHLAALQYAQSEGDEQGIATSLGSLALVDVADSNYQSARTNFAEAIAAYLRAGMPDAAEQLRETAVALINQRTPLETVVDRQPPASVSLESRKPGDSR